MLYIHSVLCVYVCVFAGEFVTQTCFQGRFGDETDKDGFGAHIMIAPERQSTYRAIARIEYVELTYVGQAFKLARYPIHFHLVGNANGSYVRGCGIHNSFNRAVNIHGTHFLLMEHVVIYNIRGGAFFLEDGIETGNILQYSLAVFVISSNSLLNDDITPAGFWVTNPNNYIRHNAVAGGTHFGYWYRMKEHPEGPSYTNKIFPRTAPLGCFYNNTAHSLGWFGLWIFQVYYPLVPAMFDTFFAWNCEKGVEWVNCGDIQFANFTMVCNEKAGIEAKMINTKYPYDDINGPMMKDSLIVGHVPGVCTSTECTDRGIILPFNAGLLVNNVKFINFDNPNCACLGITVIDGICNFGCGGYKYLFKGIEYRNSPNKANFRWDYDGIFIDLDGTLSGKEAGTSVLTAAAAGLDPARCPVSADPFSKGDENAMYCSPQVKSIRFAFNQISVSIHTFILSRFDQFSQHKCIYQFIFP